MNDETRADEKPLEYKPLGDYERLRLLGRGGMGKVYLARERSTGRVVALKVLPRSFAQAPECLKRFEAEGRVARMLRHPNIVTTYISGQADGRYYISMEYIDGQTVSAILRKSGPFEVRRALTIAKQSADALWAAHQQGIVHRDIKPSNIMLDRNGQVKVMDFGVARLSWDFDLENIAKLWKESDRVLAGGMVGTPWYMSPEQLRGEPLTAGADIYSLGVTLYEMLTGSVPFIARKPDELIQQISRSGPVDVRRKNPRVPDDVAHLISRMLSAWPNSRPRTSKDVVQALDGALANSSLVKRLMHRAMRLLPGKR